MSFNILLLLGTGLIPLAIGQLWYGVLFNKQWLQVNNFTVDEARKINMPLVFFLTYLFGFFLAICLNVMVIHQNSVFSILANEPGLKDPNSEVSKYLADFMQRYGQNFRTFKHGAFHGILNGIFLGLPFIAIGAMFERRSWKYIAIHVGYFIACMALMGGIICQWG